MYFIIKANSVYVTRDHDVLVITPVVVVVVIFGWMVLLLFLSNNMLRYLLSAK